MSEVIELEAVDLYRQIFQDNEAIKLLIDPATGEIVDANDAAAEFYGYAIPTLRTMNIRAINALAEPELAAALAKADRRDRTRFRFQHRHASGEIRRVEVFSGPIVVHERRLLFSIVQDVTDRERAETELAQSEARFRALVEALPIGVTVYRDGRVLYANAAAAVLLDRTDLVGTAVLDLIESSSHVEATRRIAVVVNHRTAVPPRRTHLARRDGTSTDAEVSAVPIDFDGQPAVMALLVSTEERDRLEEQLRASQRLDAVGRLAGGLAHDFNNFMSVILSAGTLLARKLPAESPLHAHLEHIESAATRAAALTRELLLFARGAEPATVAVDLSSVLEALVPLLRGSLGSQIELVIKPAPEPCPIAISRVHLEQVLVNLAVNARDAMPSGGMLTFGLTRGNDASGALVELVVRDTGSGMSSEVAKHVFEPFFTTKSAGHGTGLGLAITYGIVHAAGGTIHVDSTLGTGTAFTLRLPITA